MVVVHIVEIEKEIAGIELENREIVVVLKLSKSDVQDIVDIFEYLEARTSFKWKKEGGVQKREKYLESPNMESTEKGVCCTLMDAELIEEHIIRLDDGRWFLQCMNPITFCPFCGTMLVQKKKEAVIDV